MKEKVKEFWEEYKWPIVEGVFFIAGIALVYNAGVYYGSLRCATGAGVIAEMTPELTFGEFKKQVLNKTFDTSKYLVK